MRRDFRGRQMKNVRRQRRGQIVYKYHRKTGARLPDHLPEDHPDFVAAWLQEEQGQAPRVSTGQPGSLAACVGLFLRSSRFSELSKDYRRTIQRNAEDIADRYGQATMRHMKPQHIEKDLSTFTPHPANARLKAWRMVCAFAKVNGLADTDASAGIKKRTSPKSDGHAPWTLGEVEAFRAAWPVGTIQRAAFELLFWTGARVSDAVKLSPSMVAHDGLLVFKQGKTSNPAFVPWSCALPEWADWSEDRETLFDALKSCRGFTFMETAQNRARSTKGMSNLISAAAKSAGIEKSAHGLRKTRLTLIAEAGGSTQAIMSWGGHVTIQEAEHYTKSANRRRLLIGESVKRGGPVYKKGG